MSDAMSPVPEDHPLMKAWKAHQATDDFANSKRWASAPEHLQGSLWALFMAGFTAGLAEGERKGLERAATIANKIGTDHWHGTKLEDACDEVAGAIRALIKEYTT